MDIYLPKKSNVVKSDKGDPVFYHYIPLVGWVYRKRLKNTIELLGPAKYSKLLEAGYGSGLLLPELKRHCAQLHGMDLHGSHSSVQSMLEREGVEVDLKHASILNMPYDGSSFDAVVSVSMLEHIKELDRAFEEITRVLRPGGVAIISFPVKNKVTDYFYRLVGYDPTVIHPSSHRMIEASALRYMKVERRLAFPTFLPVDYGLYMTIRCVKE